MESIQGQLKLTLYPIFLKTAAIYRLHHNAAAYT